MFNIIENEVPIEFLIGNNAEDFPLIKKVNDLIDNPRAMEKELRKFAMKKFAYSLGGAKSQNHVTNVVRGLFAKGQLKMKAVFHKNDKGQIKLHHQKIGYFDMGDNPSIVFHGGGNESHNAYLESGENLTVRKQCDQRHHEDYDFWKQKLDNLWEEKPNPNKIVITPDRDFVKMISSSVKIEGKSNLRKEWQKYLDGLESAESNQNKNYENKEVRKLAKHQSNALEKWKNNNFQGILEHATGAGKTFTSLNAIKKLSEAKNNLMVIVGVPFTFLADQWSDELNDFFAEYDSFNGVIECYDYSKKWWENARRELILLKQKKLQKDPHLSVIVTVNDTMASDNFTNLLNEADISSNDIFVVGDECHRYTSKTYLGALPKARFKLGLSATPIIDHNNPTEGEKGLLNYFGDICDVFTLKMGLENDWLCPYEYYPHECYLKRDEFNRWKELLDQDNINLRDFQDDDNSKKDVAINKMLDVIDSSEEKYTAFNKLISSIENPEYSLVFCSERKIDDTKDIDAVCTILDQKKWRYSRITYEVKRQERNQIVNSFVRGDRQCIVAIKVLDEGIDIPTIKTAIILASSKNRRQFVQRRGRVLRKSQGKDKAIIHDFIVLPPPKSKLDGNQLIELELKRVAEMSECAENKDEVDGFIERIKNNFNYGFKD